MDHKNDSDIQKEKTNDIKQTFLASAISDIATYIQLADTKVSIIMGSFIALLAGILACYEPIANALSGIKPCSWAGIILCIIMLLFLPSTVGVFVFGVLTIRGHISVIDYKSKWFLPKTTKEYSFDEYKRDLHNMTDNDVIENMGAELYKLNDINRQKAKSMKWTIRLFAVSLSTLFMIFILLLINTM